MSHEHTAEPAGRFVIKRWHRPKFYRYRVARIDSNGPLPWLRGPGWNKYASTGGTARIGAFIVLGDWAYCVKWADSKWGSH